MLKKPFSKTVLGCCGLSLLALVTACQSLLNDHNRFQENWQIYKTHFIAAGGRVIDTGNHNSSHSEGQGYGMLLASEAGDREAFARIWQWTRTNLQQRNDSLFAWHFSSEQGITDDNNASDGDILIAWALLRAGQRWQVEEYSHFAREILSDIKQKLIRRWQSQTVLLPGEVGFDHPDGSLTINLSYWIFPAFDEFIRFDGAPVWSELSQSGLILLSKAQFGRWGLPPDWLRLDKEAKLEPKKKPVFGYDAVRIPLYLVWSNRADTKNTGAFFEFWNKEFNFQPAWTNLEDNSIDSYEASTGIKGVNALLQTLNHQEKYPFKTLSGDEDYYSASLLLLSQLAIKQIT